ncbi:hypothetical protein EV128_1229 [Rhizobium azibense]|nr:hypothetical protein EV128_1229 [Rhizobium azibense]
MTDKRTGICKGGPMDGKTITGGDVVHIAATPYDTEDTRYYRYQFDRGTYRHQGRRNVAKNGIINEITMRVCDECFMVREDYISTTCPECGSKRYHRT